MPGFANSPNNLPKRIRLALPDSLRVTASVTGVSCEALPNRITDLVPGVLERRRCCISHSAGVSLYVNNKAVGDGPDTRHLAVAPFIRFHPT